MNTGPFTGTIDFDVTALRIVELTDLNLIREQVMLVWNARGGPPVPVCFRISVLAEGWRILGAVEALTGILMCGWSTGFFLRSSTVFMKLFADTANVVTNRGALKRTRGHPRRLEMVLGYHDQQYHRYLSASKTDSHTAVDHASVERRPCVDGPPAIHAARRPQQRIPVGLLDVSEVLSVDEQQRPPQPPTREYTEDAVRGTFHAIRIRPRDVAVRCNTTQRRASTRLRIPRRHRGQRSVVGSAALRRPPLRSFL